MDNGSHDTIAEGRSLLLDILPLFTLNPDRVDSTKGPWFQSYYPIICSEAKILEDLLNESSTKHPQYAEILNRILKLFESLVKPDILSSCKSSLVCCSPRTLIHQYESQIADLFSAQITTATESYQR